MRSGVYEVWCVVCGVRCIDLRCMQWARVIPMFIAPTLGIPLTVVSLPMIITPNVD